MEMWKGEKIPLEPEGFFCIILNGYISFGFVSLLS